ncbi:MAG: hypothetical protein LBG90_09410 [Spirochaetaceae bacterium]|jgi:hypothetical protein|nr:hypothetical protein [Spirochaetaceae bacterium]
MKNIARLILVLSICFIAVFGASLIIALLQLRIDAMRTSPVLPNIRLQDIDAGAQSVLPLTLYFALLLGISYTARKNIPVPASIACLVSLGMLFAILITLGTKTLESIPKPSSPSTAGVKLGKPGLIISQPDGDGALVYLQDPGNPQSPRVLALPNAPLTYQSPGSNSSPEEPHHQISGFYRDLAQSNMFFLLNEVFQDFTFAAEQFRSRFKENILLFVLYAFGLVFLLSSLRFIMDLSGWPLANLFLGILAFRGVLGLERFLDAESTLAFISSFIGDRFPSRQISSFVFCTLGIICILFTALTHLKKSRRDPFDEDF